MNIKDENRRTDPTNIGSAGMDLGRAVFRYGLIATDYLENRLKASVRTKLRSERNLPEVEEETEWASPNESLVQGSRASQGSETRVRNRSSEKQDWQPSGFREYVMSERGDVPGWVLVVLMTTGLVTAIWAVAAPKLNAILKNSLDSMNNIR